MERHKPTETLLSKKIFLLRQKFKQLQREERIFKKRNKRYASEIQFQKEQLKGLEDEKVILQKELFDQQYCKSVYVENNITLNNHLSSLWKDVNALQTKIIVSWRENHLERHQQSSRKCTSGSFPMPKDHPITEQLVDDACLLQPLQNCQNLENDLQHVKSASGNEKEKGVDSGSPSQLEPVCKPESVNTNESGLPSTGQGTIYTDDIDLTGSLNSFYRRKTVLLERNSELEIRRQSEKVIDSPPEPFHGFVEDINTTAKFTEMIERLSLTCCNLDKLRDDTIAQSLTLFETNPDIKDTTSSVLNAEWPKQSSFQEVEVSIPQLDLQSLTVSSISAAEDSVSKGEKSMESSKDIVQRKTASVSPDSSCKVASSHLASIGTTQADVSELGHHHSRPCSLATINAQSSPKRDTLPDSPSCTLSAGRVLRRARSGVVTYKEKSLNVKLRRN